MKKPKTMIERCAAGESLDGYGQPGTTQWSLWRMLNGISAHDVFKLWGAEEVYFANNSGSPGYKTYFLRVGSNWFYAHTDGTSCYVAAARKFDGPTGAIAVLQHIHANLVARINSVKADLDSMATEEALLSQQIDWAKKDHKP